MIAVDDLHDGDVGPGDEAQQTKKADDNVLNQQPDWNALCVEGEDLQQGRKYERQSTAADRTYQWDDQVQLWNQDSQCTCRTKWGQGSYFLMLMTIWFVGFAKQVFSSFLSTHYKSSRFLWLQQIIPSGK